MMLPSSELLSEVLGINIESHIVLSKDNRSIIYAEISPIGGSIISDINIYELMHMMKEWAFDNGYSLEVFKSDDKCYEVVPKQYDEFLEEWVSYPYHIGETEPEAVTITCEWILEQQK